VDRPPHDIVDQLLKKGWARQAFESGILTEGICVIPGDDIGKLTTELAEITNRFGREGIRATFNHIALDYIAELIELGYNKEEIQERLINNALMSYISDYEQAFADISRESKPSSAKVQRRKEFEELAKSGVHGVFIVDYGHPPLSPAPALNRIKSKLKKGETVCVKWGVDAYDAKKGRISRKLCKMEDLAELIAEIKTTELRE